jgi:hypothetical protein
MFTAFNKQNNVRWLVTTKFGRVWKEVAVTELSDSAGISLEDSQMLQGLQSSD